jgi:hypothetical protein
MARVLAAKLITMLEKLQHRNAKLFVQLMLCPKKEKELRADLMRRRAHLQSAIKVATHF